MERESSVEKFFKRKYGIEKVCKLPTIHEGYKIKSCNTERENILPSECKVICDKENGYLPNEFISFDDENTADLEGGAECNDANGEFEFVGCYPNGEITVGSFNTLGLLLKINQFFTWMPLRGGSFHRE